MFRLGSRVAPHAVIVGNLLNRGAGFSSSFKLFVRGLSYDTTEIALKYAFSQHGDIVEGKSNGYGFVKFALENEASAALEKMIDKALDGRKIRVHYVSRG